MNLKKRISLMLVLILVLQIILPTVSSIGTNYEEKKQVNEKEICEINTTSDIEDRLEEETEINNAVAYKSSVVKNGKNKYISNNEEKTFTEEYLEWLKLTEEEKKNTLEPRKEYVSFDSLYDGSDKYLELSIEDNTVEEEKTLIEKFLAYLK